MTTKTYWFYPEMTEKIKFKAANPPRIMKYDHVAHSALFTGTKFKIFCRYQRG